MATRKEPPVADQEPPRGIPIEKKPGNQNTAPPAGPPSTDVENSPSPYDQAKPGTPDDRIIRQGERKTSSGDSRAATADSDSGSREVAVGIGDGLEGAPVEDFDEALSADAQGTKDRHAADKKATKNDRGVNHVAPSREADAEVGLGEGMEGAPVEEYEEELEIGTEKAAHKKGS